MLLTRPEYTLLTGNRCVNCHISAQGSGQRNQLGAYARNETSLVTDKSVIDFFDDFNQLNAFGNGVFLWGFDYRMQTARLGDPSNSHREVFSMQMTPYLTIQPFSWLKVSGQYNLLYAFDFLKEVDEKGQKTVRYPGQDTWQAFAVLQPNYKYPSLKIGYFSPAIGTKYDDHTLIIRQSWTTYPIVLVTPDNSEIAAEINYDRLHWLQLTAGAYGSNNMSKIMLPAAQGARKPIVDEGTVSYLFKTVFTPRFDDNFVNTYAGGSYFVNGDFNIVSAFAGVGLTDIISLLGEYTRANKENIRLSNNYSIGIYYPLLNALALTARYESASTDDYSLPESNNQDFTNYQTNAIVLGANIYPLPNIEIKPEFRILDRKDFESHAQQWTLQLHLYY